jgi:hypothetical protein
MRRANPRGLRTQRRGALRVTQCGQAVGEREDRFFDLTALRIEAGGAHFENIFESGAR